MHPGPDGRIRLAEDEVLCRLVASFATRDEDVTAFCEALG
jgi:hypothetical protein